MTTIAGTLFLIWFFFSPLLAAGTYFKWVSPEAFLPAFVPYLIAVYALTGIAAYYLAQLCGGIYVKEKEEKPIDIGHLQRLPMVRGHFIYRCCSRAALSL